jgi:hypothetical protein
MSKLLDRMSEFFAHRKGLLPLIGMALILANLILQFILPSDHWLVSANLCLHIGLIAAIFGFMLAWAL